MTTDSGFRQVRVSIPLYQAVMDRRLHFLIVENNPPIVLGDILKILEYSTDRGELTGRLCYVLVKFIIGDPSLGLRVGYAAVQFEIKILTDRLRLPP